MEKLTKQEVNALANRILEKIKESFETQKRTLEQLWQPDERYSFAKSKIDRINELESQIEALHDEKCNLYTDLRGFAATYNLNRYDFAEMLQKYKEKKLGINFKIPEINEIKDEIIIQNIDSELNVNDFIKQLVNKYTLK
jgi:hypothetical protein